jgi:hypothetical protein
MHIKHSPIRLICRTAAIATFAAAATLGLQAQQAASTEGSHGVAVSLAQPVCGGDRFRRDLHVQLAGRS